MPRLLPVLKHFGTETQARSLQRMSVARPTKHTGQSHTYQWRFTSCTKSLQV